MTGLNDTDIRLNDEWQLTQAADGDAPLCSGLDCLYQNIALEAITQPGDLFYDPSFGGAFTTSSNRRTLSSTGSRSCSGLGSVCRSGGHPPGKHQYKRRL